LPTYTPTSIAGDIILPLAPIEAEPPAEILTKPQEPAAEEEKTGVITFGSKAEEATPDTQLPSSNPSNVLWGATAAAVIGAVMAQALEAQRKRKEAEAASYAAAKKEAASLNEAERQRKINNYLEGKAIRAAEAETQRIATMQSMNEEILAEKEDLLGLKELPPKKPSYVVPDMSWKQGDLAAMDDFLNKPSSGLAWGKTLQDWGSTYVSQGYQTNDCGPSNLAIVLNALTTTTWDKTMVSPSRLGAIAGNGEGATPPWSFVEEFNRLAAENGINTIATRRVNATKEDLINELNNGNPVTIIRNFTGEAEGGSHYQTVIAYDADTDIVYLMDPDPTMKSDVIGEQVKKESWTDFEADWSKPLKKTADGGDIDISASITLLQPNQMIIYR